MLAEEGSIAGTGGMDRFEVNGVIQQITQRL